MVTALSSKPSLAYGFTRHQAPKLVSTSPLYWTLGPSLLKVVENQSINVSTVEASLVELSVLGLSCLSNVKLSKEALSH